MAKEGGIKIEGEIVDVLPNAMFKVTLKTGTTILGYISGKMRQNEIRILDGDRVEIEVSPYDLTKGRITRRL
jgi:translation initiation factor IF-1